MTSGEKGILLEPGEGKSLSVLSDTYTEKVVGRDTNGAFTLMELTLRGEAPLDTYIMRTKNPFMFWRARSSSRWAARV